MDPLEVNKINFDKVHFSVERISLAVKIRNCRMYSLQHFDAMTPMHGWLVYFDPFAFLDWVLWCPFVVWVQTDNGLPWRKQNWFRVINNVSFSVEETSWAVNCKMHSLQYFDATTHTNDSFILIHTRFQFIWFLWIIT